MLGPILFLVFISDLPEYVLSSTKPFANDLILDHKISTHDDRKILQNDLYNVTFWENKCGMKFHQDTCEAIHISQSNNHNKHQYHLRSYLIKITDNTKYLGVTINIKLDWKPHLGNTVNKATRTHLKLPAM